MGLPFFGCPIRIVRNSLNKLTSLETCSNKIQTIYKIIKDYSITAAKPPFFTILISMVLSFVTFFSTLL